MARKAGQSVENKIEMRLRGKGRGFVVFQQDYAGCGTPSAVKSAFFRLYTDGVLLRLAHGIYYYPKEDKEYGLGVIYPSVEEIAQAIAKRDNAKIVPTGAYALNRLGLSTQIPMNVVFLTNGAPRRVKIGDGHGILFKHSSCGKNFAYKSELMMLVVAAMRTIGEEKMTGEEKQKFVEYIETLSVSEFNHDLKLVPAWVRKILIAR
jgi:hypothetical protein